MIVSIRLRPLLLLTTLVAAMVGNIGIARAVGERITDVRVMGNSRTTEDTIRSLAGVRIGETLDADTLQTVRARLNTAGLFADLNVWWEAHGDGVRINIVVKDKFPWAPVPTGSWSSNNKALGLLFVHGNLFGRGKQMLIGGRLASLDSGAVLAYRDPALFGTWIYWEMKALAAREVIPEYDVNSLVPASPWRQSTFDSYAVEPAIGIAWFRRVRTQVSWRLQSTKSVDARQQVLDPNTGERLFTGTGLDGAPRTSRGGIMGMGRAGLSFDWRNRENAIMTGPALGGSLDFASSAFGSDFDFWRGSVFWQQGVRVFRRQNFIYSVGGITGHNTPIWWDTTAGGDNLRGYIGQQFRGDTQLAGHIEYHFPLFSIGSLDLRALGFYDSSMIWYRSLPTDTLTNPGYLTRSNSFDQRTFKPGFAVEGLDPKRDLHNAVGGGLRFFLRSVAVPLVGFDAGYGIEAGHWRFLLIVGA
jgi:outer membrane protein insertion porin family